MKYSANSQIEGNSLFLNRLRFYNLDSISLGIVPDSFPKYFRLESLKFSRHDVEFFLGRLEHSSAKLDERVDRASNVVTPGRRLLPIQEAAQLEQGRTVAPKGSRTPW
jgi:hypothetical protein